MLMFVGCSGKSEIIELTYEQKLQQAYKEVQRMFDEVDIPPEGQGYDPRIGMRKDQLNKTTWGENPSRVSLHTNPDGSKQELLVYNFSDGSGYLQFNNDVLVRINDVSN
jgi:hypothetical protein